MPQKKSKGFKANHIEAQKSILNFTQILEHLPRYQDHKISKIKSDLPKIFINKANKNYALLDSGYGLKLEKFGDYKIIRPESQAFWIPRFEREFWKEADAFFTGNLEEEGSGRWEFLKKNLDESWAMYWSNIPFWGRFTSFRHVGIFPEQAPHWDYIENLIKNSPRPLKVLNLFGYTGIASLIAAKAGAFVTHVDASKKTMIWAKMNQEKAHLCDKPIRWICDDALNFVLREERRQKKYDIILLDPPAYGRGPKGEIWRLFEHLPLLLKTCCALLDDEALTLILTAYSIRSSFYSLHNLMFEAFKNRDGVISSGELVIEEAPFKLLPMRQLSTSIFSRWCKNT